MIIGLYGNRGAGKDAVGDVLAGVGFVKIAFADALREEVAEAFDVPATSLTDRSTKETPQAALKLCCCKNMDFRNLFDDHILPRSPREIMQKWGTEYRRAGDASYWRRQVHAKIALHRSGLFGLVDAVIPDVRYQSEYDFVIGGLGGLMIRVTRPEVDSAEDALREAGDPTALHASARALDGFHFDDEVDNGGTLNGLKEAVLYQKQRWQLLAALRAHKRTNLLEQSLSRQIQG
jgi:hypothetical protein